MGWLAKMRGYVTGIAQREGFRVGSAGTHPFSLFERQRITAKDRYRALIDQLQYVARRELIFGMHIHVAVDGPEKAIQVVNGLLPHLAPLLALSASSPFWRGEPTGLASSRQMVFSAFPRSGPPPRFRDYADYADGRRPARALRVHRGLHAHLVGHTPAPPPRHGRDTHLRRGDAREDAVAIAAYCQALVKQLSERYDTGAEIPSYHRILTSENKWLAARYGLEAPVMDLASGAGTECRWRGSSAGRSPSSAARARARLERELEGVLAILDRGNSADRQLGSTTRTATSSRSPARSRTPPRLLVSPAPVQPPAPLGPRIGRGAAPGPRLGLVLAPGDNVPEVPTSGLAPARRRGRSARCWGPATRPLLLPLGLVADLNERDPAPAGQGRGPGGGGRPPARDLARLGLVTPGLGRGALGVDALLSDWNGEATRASASPWSSAGCRTSPPARRS